MAEYWFPLSREWQRKITYETPSELIFLIIFNHNNQINQRFRHLSSQNRAEQFEQKKAFKHKFKGFLWSRQTDLNCWPADYKSFLIKTHNRILDSNFYIYQQFMHISLFSIFLLFSIVLKIFVPKSSPRVFSQKINCVILLLANKKQLY